MCEQHAHRRDDFGPGEFRGGPPPRRDRGPGGGERREDCRDWGGRRDSGPDSGECPECAAQRSSPGEEQLDHTSRLWEEAFQQALHAVRVDALKERIRASWGKDMKKVADVVVGSARKELEEFFEKKSGNKKTTASVKKRLKKAR